MFEVIGVAVVAFFVWKMFSAIVSGGARGHMMRSVAHAVTLGVPYDFAYSMINERKLMKYCRMIKERDNPNFGKKKLYIQNGEILKRLHQDYLLEEKKKNNPKLAQAELEADLSEKIIPAKFRSHIFMWELLRALVSDDMSREDCLFILQNQRGRIDDLMRYYELLQDGETTNGEMEECDLFLLWQGRLKRAIHTIHNERFDDHASDWGTDEGIRFLIQRAANNPDVKHRFPNLKYDSVCNFVEQGKGGVIEWFPGYGGYRTWLDIGGHSYYVVIHTLIPELKDDSGVEIWAEIDNSQDIADDADNSQDVVDYMRLTDEQILGIETKSD